MMNNLVDANLNETATDCLEIMYLIEECNFDLTEEESQRIHKRISSIYDFLLTRVTNG